MAEPNDVRDLVTREVHRVLGNAQVAAEYPELHDRGSEFFQKTAIEMRKLPEDLPGGRVRAAAQSVELQMRREGTWKEPARAAAGGRHSEDDDTPSAQQEQLAVGIIGGDRDKAVAAYREQAERGVNVSLGSSLARGLEQGE